MESSYNVYKEKIENLKDNVICDIIELLQTKEDEEFNFNVNNYPIISEDNYIFLIRKVKISEKGELIIYANEEHQGFHELNVNEIESIDNIMEIYKFIM